MSRLRILKVPGVEAAGNAHLREEQVVEGVEGGDGGAQNDRQKVGVPPADVVDVEDGKEEEVQLEEGGDEPEVQAALQINRVSKVKVLSSKMVKTKTHYHLIKVPEVVDHRQVSPPVGGTGADVGVGDGGVKEGPRAEPLEEHRQAESGRHRGRKGEVLVAGKEQEGGRLPFPLHQMDVGVDEAAEDEEGLQGDGTMRLDGEDSKRTKRFHDGALVEGGIGAEEGHWKDKNKKEIAEGVHEEVAQREEALDAVEEGQRGVFRSFRRRKITFRLEKRPHVAHHVQRGDHLGEGGHLFR